MRFFKKGSTGARGKNIFAGNGEKPGWFYNGAWDIFEVSLHNWQRGANVPVL